LLRPGPRFELSVAGPFAGSIDGDNLVATAAQRVGRMAPDLIRGSVLLEKQIPVSAGLGGGSADAAALLRVLRRSHPNRAQQLDWDAIAAGLGADVPVCLYSRPALMWGIGEHLRPVERLPRLPLVLVKPKPPLPTAAVFAGLGAPAIGSAPAGPPPLPLFASPDEFAAYLQSLTNDLEHAASRLCPKIEQAKAALASMPGVLLARMSGSGPTCFGIFSSPALAEAAARSIARQEPEWWVRATEMAE
jgi:4-diphosphocytidyl-2-C-methyl-D-erythritol kinase